MNSRKNAENALNAPYNFSTHRRAYNKEEEEENDNLKKMINVVLDNCNKEKSKNVYLTINPRNEKSKNALTHIGFYNAEGKNYKISYNDFEKRVTMNNVKY